MKIETVIAESKDEFTQQVLTVVMEMILKDKKKELNHIDFKKKEEALKNEFNSVYGKNDVKEFIFCVWEKIEECSDDCKVIS